MIYEEKREKNIQWIIILFEYLFYFIFIDNQ